MTDYQKLLAQLASLEAQIAQTKAKKLMQAKTIVALFGLSERQVFGPGPLTLRQLPTRAKDKRHDRNSKI